MLAGMRAAGTAALCALVLGLASCGGGDDDDEATGGLAQEAAAVVEQLEKSIRAGEFERICSELLSAEVRRQAGGGECPAMLERTSAGRQAAADPGAEDQHRGRDGRGPGRDRRRGPGPRGGHDPARARGGRLPDLVAQRLSARSVASKSVRGIGPTPGEVAPASK